MSNNSQFNHLGDQIKGALNEALTTGDFKNLNSLVSDTVTSALHDAGRTTSKAWQQKEEWKAKQQQGSQYNTAYWQQQRAAREKQFQENRAAMEKARQEAVQQRRLEQEQERYRRTGLLVEVKNEGMAAGVLFIVFGAIANIPLFVLSICSLAFGWGAATAWLLFFLLVSIFFICLGKKKIDLIRMAKRYVRLCGNKLYSEIDDLASQVGKSSKEVLKDLRKILQKGIIPSARLDKKGTTLMLNDVIYKQYQETEKARAVRERAEKEKKVAQTPSELVAEARAQQKTELEQMISEGQECIRKLRDYNDLIPGEVISEKMYHLEDLLKEIFARVEKEPAQMPRMHKVMNYYLPTTLKLVEAYHEFDKVSNPGPDIVEAKDEIEKTLDTINEAFVELLNSLFQDKVFDITTDAQVLQTMLANEGLTRDKAFAKVGNYNTTK